MYIYINKLYYKGLQAEGNAGMVLLTTLGTKSVHHQEFLQLRPDIWTQFRNECNEYHQIAQKPENASRNGFGVWGLGVGGSGITKPKLKAHPLHCGHVGTKCGITRLS